MSRVPITLTVPTVPTAPLVPTATTASTQQEGQLYWFASPKSRHTRESVQVSQSVNSSHSSHTAEVKQSTSIHSVIRVILLIRFSQSRIWSIATSTTTREPSSIRLAVRIWARSRQSSYSATLLVCVIRRSCWRKYIVITLLITELYYFNHPYCLNGNQGIDLLAASIIIIVTGIYDSRWRVSSRLRLPAIGRIYMVLQAG